MTNSSIPDQEKLLIEASPVFFDALLNVIDRCCTGTDRIVILHLEDALPVVETASISPINSKVAEAKALQTVSRYLQVLVDPNGALQVEARANYETEKNHLNAADELAMLHLGWRAPSVHSPNWHRVFPDPWPWPSPVATELVVRTLLDIFRAQGTTLCISYIEANRSHAIDRCTQDCLAV